MNYSKLINDNKIKAGNFSDKQVSDCLALAERDIATAGQMIDVNSDWAYNIAYNAMLQAARAFMFSKGYRATGEGQHATTIQFAMISLGEDFTATLSQMDRMRRKRNQVVYDSAGLISLKEVTDAINTAKSFVKNINDLLKM